MGSLPVVLLLCSFHALAALAQTPKAETDEAPGGNLPANCREEKYTCTRMYSVHKPMKECIGLEMCFFRTRRVYVINKEVCSRKVCEEDEYQKAELCRVFSGWPRRVERSSNKKLCRSRLGNTKTWANMAQRAPEGRSDNQ